MIEYLGIDEVGYGAVAGPLVLCAVKSPKFKLFGLKDSKQYDEQERTEIVLYLLDNGIEFELELVTVDEIDKNNILYAWTNGLKRLIIKARTKFGNLPVLIDGNKIPKEINGCYALIKADENDQVVVAASIIAKVTRDNLMKLLDQSCKEYKFIDNKGYATKEHIKLIKAYGLSQFHRNCSKKFLTEEYCYGTV
jgi:ribonuclease HII